MTYWEKLHQIICLNTAFDVTCGNYKQQRLSSYGLLNRNEKRQNITWLHCARNMTKICETRCNGGDFLKTKQNGGTELAQIRLPIKT
jgi:hypothetical protein